MLIAHFNVLSCSVCNIIIYNCIQKLTGWYYLLPEAIGFEKHLRACVKSYNMQYTTPPSGDSGNYSGGYSDSASVWSWLNDDQSTTMYGSDGCIPDTLSNPSCRSKPPRALRDITNDRNVVETQRARSAKSTTHCVRKPKHISSSSLMFHPALPRTRLVTCFALVLL